MDPVSTDKNVAEPLSMGSEMIRQSESDQGSEQSFSPPGNVDACVHQNVGVAQPTVFLGHTQNNLDCLNAQPSGPDSAHTTGVLNELHVSEVLHLVSDGINDNDASHFTTVSAAPEMRSDQNSFNTASIPVLNAGQICSEASSDISQYSTASDGESVSVISTQSGNSQDIPHVQYSGITQTSQLSSVFLDHHSMVQERNTTGNASIQQVNSSTQSTSTSTCSSLEQAGANIDQTLSNLNVVLIQLDKNGANNHDTKGLVNTLQNDGISCHTKLKSPTSGGFSVNNMVFVKLQDRQAVDQSSSSNEMFVLVKEPNTGSLLNSILMHNQMGNLQTTSPAVGQQSSNVPTFLTQFNVAENLHAVAEANLIAQTQETIVQQLNMFRTKEDDVVQDSKEMEFINEKQLPNSELKGSGAGKFSCDVGSCRRIFKTDEELKNHQTYHKPLQCPVEGCGRKFTWPAHLKYHQLTHAGDKRYSCGRDGCGKLFYTAQQLRVHLRSHTGDKPFQCSECQKCFTTAGNLKNHSRSHTGEKPFLCEVEECGKAFAEYSSLKKHKVTHTGQKPFVCELCNKTFSQSSSRRSHMKRHLLAHSKEDKSEETKERQHRENVVVEVVLQSEQDDVLQYRDFTDQTELQTGNIGIGNQITMPDAQLKDEQAVIEVGNS